MKSLKISTINAQAKVSGEETLASPVFEKPASPALIAQAVLSFLSNQRRALATTKSRAEVAGSGRKIWRQKGTGRARHKDRQAPIFVGGGIAHGPKGAGNYQKRLSQKMAQRALFSILAEKIRAKKVFLVEVLKFKKSKEAAVFVEDLKKNLKAEGKIAFLLTKDESQLKRALRNLKGVVTLNTESLNSYYLLNTDFLFMTKLALKQVKVLLGEKDASKH
ncbi:MAG TPA: 50S ribosomal protein L4 [Clostridia bacterium]|nr:50S ribosomal protein L4 [Clostridia bacterium]